MTAVACDPPVVPAMSFDPHKVRADFPILRSTVYGKPLIYLDNGATTQKPQAVIDAIARYYAEQNANIHRGVYRLSQVATEAYEAAREKVARFINAAENKQVVFTRGTTEGVNLVAFSWGRANLARGDEVIVSAMEHHSNIVPWQIACEAAGAHLRVIPMDDAGELVMDEYARLLNPRTKMVSVVHLSNSLGTVNDVKTIARMAHEVGAKVFVDGAQWAAHYPTDVQDLDVDFYAFSGHKLYGPTGIGVLYGRRELLEAMPPYQGGGDMIESVTFEKTTYAQLPNKFEAGTPDIAGAVGLGAAIDYVRSVGFENFVPYEESLHQYAVDRLRTVPGLRFIGAARRKASVVSFVIEDPPLSALDVGTRLDAEGVAVRTGHHCCQPVMDRFKIPGTVRASLAMYNTKADIDALVAALTKAREEALRKKPAGASPAAPAGLADALKFPKPFAASPQKAAEDLAELFESLDDREARNEYVVELGEKLPAMPADLKTDATRVHGCMSTVHLFGRKRPGTADVLEFLADSDAHVVRGLIGVLQKLYSGQRAGDILAFDVEDFFRQIGLDQFISSQRRNGLAGMVQRIRALAGALNQGEPTAGG